MLSHFKKNHQQFKSYAAITQEQLERDNIETVTSESLKGPQNRSSCCGYINQDHNQSKSGK